ncbi:hypothetical protein EYF80_055748 [Liparis tanakae]|uniref:Uncharacterized protein n=1 Tax=Liparis tanakae TaxID=230148 RepID=A0A4Z2EYX2_9TELE|nr:hypothetical protein EYF80_055748 [Liparis tanakae]
MYSSAVSQPGDVPAETPTDTEPPDPPGRAADPNSANDMLCTSQTLDDEPLTPEVVAPPQAPPTQRSVWRGDAAACNAEGLHRGGLRLMCGAPRCVPGFWTERHNREHTDVLQVAR